VTLSVRRILHDTGLWKKKINHVSSIILILIHQQIASKCSNRGNNEYGNALGPAFRVFTFPAQDYFTKAKPIVAFGF